MRKNLFGLLFPVMMALLLILLLRISEDMGRDEYYWQIKSPLFLVTDLIATVASYYLMVSLILTKWARYNISHRTNLLFEYGFIVTLSSTIVVVYMLLRSYIQYGEVYEMKSYVDPSFFVSLFMSMNYGILKSRMNDEERTRLLLLQSEVKGEQLQSELRALRAQYHPHFLFNALNTIYFQINPENITPRQTIELLSDILRYQVNCGAEKVPLDKEIEYLKKDIVFRKLRCSDSLVLTVDIAPETDMEIYPLLFTPLVENAFKYVGGEKYFIHIELTNTKQGLYFAITNSIPEINTTEKKDTATGLDNLRRRLSLLYPDAHSLTCTQAGNEYNAILKIKNT